MSTLSQTQTASIRYKVDHERFVSDPLEGETIIMDLRGGQLFLLEAASAEMWTRIIKGDSRDAMISTLRSKHGNDVAMAGEQFLQQLTDLGLIAETESAESGKTAQQLDDWPTQMGEFKLTTYDDMTSIITMDPIHDVDPDRGWPHQQSD